MKSWHFRFWLQQTTPLRSAVVVSVLAIAAMTLSCSRDPNVRKQKYYDAAMRYFNKGQYNEAALELRNAIKIDPSFAQAHYELAQCYLKLSLIRPAYTELLTTTDLDPQHWKAQIDEGYLLYATHQFDNAREKATLVLSHDERNAEALALLANIAAAEGHMDQAITEMEKSAAASNDWAKVLNLAMLEEIAHQPQAAEADFKKAEALNPKSGRPYQALGGFYARQNRANEAEQQFRQAIELEPKNPANRGVLVRFYFDENQPAKAEQTASETKLLFKGDPAGYRMLAGYYILTHQTDKAMTEYASLCKQYPDDLVVKKASAGLLIEKNDLAGATRVDDDILKSNPADPEGQILKGRILIAEQRANDALIPLQAILKDDPNNERAHYYLGEVYDQIGKADRAEAEWREAVRLSPESAEANMALAAAAQRDHDYQQLGVSAAALMKLMPTSPVGYTFDAVVRASHKDLKGTTEDLQKAIDVSPKHPLGYTRMGQLLMAEKRYTEAEKALGTALENDPSFTEALRALARVYMLQKQPGEAIRRVNQQIAKAPNISDYYLLLGELLSSQKDFAGAEAALQKAVNLDNNNVNAFVLLAKVQVSEGAQERAIASCERSIQVSPTHLPSYVMLALLEDHRGNWQKAEDLYRKALGVKPDYAMAENDLAYLMLSHGGNLDVAFSLAQGARRLMPEAPGVADTLACVYYKKGEYAAAVDLLNEALQKQPDDPDFNYHIALAYQMKKDRQAAIAHFEHVLKVSPTYPNASDVQQALASLKKG